MNNRSAIASEATNASGLDALTGPPLAHGRLRRFIGRRMPTWLKPRLGQAEPQYPGRPLKVPARYRRQRPPTPAPTISIVTPSLNHRRFIVRTIESVLGQGYPALEYTIIDGGSTDGSVELARSYGDQLHHFETGRDRGQANAINRGFERSRGEIMAWLNSDDVLLPGALAHVASVMAARPDVDVVYGHRILLDSQDQDIGLWVTPRHGHDSLRWFDFLPQETAFWRRPLWNRVGGIDERFHVAFDWDLFLRFQEAGAKIVRLPRFLGGFRLHPEQRTQRERDPAQRELDRIRARANGREVDLDEARARVDRLRARSLPLYAWHRLAARVPGRRIAVFDS